MHKPITAVSSQCDTSVMRLPFGRYVISAIYLVFFVILRCASGQILYSTVKKVTAISYVASELSVSMIIRRSSFDAQ
jgi:hypothetical protein